MVDVLTYSASTNSLAVSGTVSMVNVAGTGIDNNFSVPQTFGSSILQTGSAGAGNQSPFLNAGDAFSDFIANGMQWAIPSSASLTTTMSSGSAYLNDVRALVPAVSGYSFPASNDTYVSFNNSGVPDYQSVANGATAPTPSSGYVQTAKIVTSPIQSPAATLSTSTSGSLASGTYGIALVAFDATGYGAVGASGTVAVTSAQSGSGSIELSWVNPLNETSMDIYATTAGSTTLGLVASGVTGTTYIYTGSVAPGAAAPTTATSNAIQKILYLIDPKPQQFDIYPENFGAVGDVNIVSNMYQDADGAMTSGSAVLICATYSPFLPTDIGKIIGVGGAGASGSTLSATISGYTSASEVTLSVAASTTVSKARVIFGTDDTQALVSWLSYVKSNNGRIGRILPRFYFVDTNALIVDQSVEISGASDTFLVPTPASSPGALLSVAVTPNTDPTYKNISGQLIGVKIHGISGFDWRLVDGVCAFAPYSVDQIVVNEVHAYGLRGGHIQINPTNPFNGNALCCVRESHFEKCFDIFSGDADHPNLYIYTETYSDGTTDAHNDLFFTDCKSIYSYGSNIFIDSLNASLSVNQIHFINQQCENGAFLPGDATNSINNDLVVIGQTGNQIIFSNSWIAGSYGYVSGSAAGYACLRIGNYASQKTANYVSFIGGYINAQSAGIVIESANTVLLDDMFIEQSVPNEFALVVGSLPYNSLTIGAPYTSPDVIVGRSANFASAGSSMSTYSGTNNFIHGGGFNTLFNYSASALSGNTLTIYPSHTPAVLVNGLSFSFIWQSSPNAGAVTISVGGLNGGTILSQQNISTPPGYFTYGRLYTIVCFEGNFYVQSGVEVNQSTTTTNAPTSGSVNMFMPLQGNGKQVTLTFSGYENDTTTNQTINFPTPFTVVPLILGNNTGLTITASTTGITITAPDVTTTYSGTAVIMGN